MASPEGAAVITGTGALNGPRVVPAFTATATVHDPAPSAPGMENGEAGAS